MNEWEASIVRMKAIELVMAWGKHTGDIYMSRDNKEITCAQDLPEYTALIAQLDKVTK
jgi:hypothetical protein